MNRFLRIEGLYEKEGGIDEWDHHKVLGTVRYHYTTRKNRKWTGQEVVLWVFPCRFSMDDYEKDSDSGGDVWMDEGELFTTWGESLIMKVAPTGKRRIPLELNSEST